MEGQAWQCVNTKSHTYMLTVGLKNTRVNQLTCSMRQQQRCGGAEPGEASVYIFLTHRAEVICTVQLVASNLFLLFTWEAAMAEFKEQATVK